MVNEFEKVLDFDSDTFEDMKRDMNFILQRLVGTMQEKGAIEGSMTLKIDVNMVKAFIPNYDPDIKGETREVIKPQFKHKVTSAVKINDDKSGIFNNEMEMVMDEDSGVFKLIPIANTQQRTIFDIDFQQKDDEKCVNDEDGKNYIEGSWRPALPGPSDTEESEDESKYALEMGEGLPDITEELLGEDGEKPQDDDYGYDAPEDNPEDNPEE